MSHSFLGRAKVHNAIWSVIGGLVVLLVGIAWSQLTGPEKVYVTNSTNKRSDTLVVSLGGTGRADSASGELKLAVENGSSGSSEAEGQQEENRGAKRANSLKLPRFEMPNNVEGYTEAGIQSFAKAECPSGHIDRGEAVSLKFQTFQHAPVAKLTPIFVSVYKRSGEQYSYLAMSQQYELHRGANTINFAADFPPAKYKLSYGFYLETDLSQEYPPFYSKSCWFEIEA
jgi:hypothetical protein